MLQNVDKEKFGNTKPDHIVRYRAKKMHEQFMENESMATQTQILRCLLVFEEVEGIPKKVSKKLKEAWSLLGIQRKTKDSKVKQNVFENIANVIKTIGKSRKKDTSVACRIIQTTLFHLVLNKNV